MLQQKPKTKINCDADFGYGLVHRWRASRQLWCGDGDDDDNQSATSKSIIHCYPLMQAGHGGHGDNLCVLHNVLFQPSLAFRDDPKRTAALVRMYRDSKHAYPPYLRFTPGESAPVLRASCRKTPAWDDQKLPGWNLDWMRDALVLVDPENNNNNHDDNTNINMIVMKPLLILQRDGFTRLRPHAAPVRTPLRRRGPPPRLFSFLTFS